MDEDALLAQALWAAEQAELYEGGGGFGSDAAAGCDSDSDYGQQRSTKRRKAQQAKKGRAPPSKPRSSRKPPLAPPAARSTARHDTLPGDANNNSNNLPAADAELGAGTDAAATMAAGSDPDCGAAGGEAVTASGRRKRKDSGQKRERGKGWTPEEEEAFLSGLETHGRDWKAIAAGVGTRDSRAVASHAQKHFIRCCMAGTPLPPRVLESGPGYTLSGNLLDPASAAAAAYGFKYDLLLERLEGEALATALSGIMPLADTDADAAAAAGGGGGGGGGEHDSGSARDQKAAGGAGGAPKRQRRTSSSNSTAQKQAARAVAQKQQRQQQQQSGSSDDSTDADMVAAILASAAPPPLAASEAAALAAAAAAAVTAVPAAHTGATSAQVVIAVEAFEPPTAAGGADQQQGQQAAAHQTGANSSHAQGTAAAAAGADAVAAEGHPAIMAPDVPKTSAPAAAEQAGPDAPGAAATAAAAAAAAAARAAAAAADGLTEYARSRPRREGAGGAGGRGTQLGLTSESLELVAPVDFLGPVGAPGGQPYAVEVDLQALLLMDVHVHLSGCEVIGLLGGTWQPQQRLLRVTVAYPCRRAAGSADATSVELDPASEVEARGHMADAGQRCVGWYHSHPIFEPVPSLKDMTNQRNYQALTRDDNTNTNTTSGGCGCGASTGPGSSSNTTTGAGRPLEPFVGFILSPFDPVVALPHTCTKAFVVGQRGPQQHLVPYNIRYGLVNSSSPPGSGALEAIRRLLDSCRHDMARTDFSAFWRPFSVRHPLTGRLLGPHLTKLDKLLAGLRWWCGHVADRGAVEDWLGALVQHIQEQWGVQLAPKEAATPPEQQQTDDSPTTGPLEQPQQPVHDQQQQQEEVAAPQSTQPSSEALENKQQQQPQEQPC